MKDNLLEDVPLVPKYVMLNPGELDKFDKRVGVGNRSKAIRELIKKSNLSDGEKCIEDISGFTGKV
jgi:hypothetical protein